MLWGLPQVDEWLFASPAVAARDGNMSHQLGAFRRAPSLELPHQFHLAKDVQRAVRRGGENQAQVMLPRRGCDRGLNALASIARTRIRQNGARYFRAGFTPVLINDQLAEARLRRITLHLVLVVGQTEVARQAGDIESQ